MRPTVTVLVFGTFDGIHDGHRFFLSQARALGDRLVVVVARDATAGSLKAKPPRRNEERRLDEVRRLKAVDSALLGDETLGAYRVIEMIRPDVIALGHDQDALEGDLKRWLSKQTYGIRLEKISKHERGRRN